MNSRPLAVEGLNDPHEPLAITPNHLLTQKTNVILAPPGQFSSSDLHTKKQWRQVQFLANQFWDRWRKEYLSQLQKRQKWTTTKQNLQVGDVVLLEDSNHVRGEWRMARVTGTHPGKDGLVRHVTLRPGDRSNERPRVCVQRPVSKVKLLITNF